MEFKDYLTFLQKLHQELTELNTVEQKKIAAVQVGDLDALDVCMKQEQAATMSLRGQEQRRNQLLKQLGLEQVPLRELPRHAPPPCGARLSRRWNRSCGPIRYFPAHRALPVP